MTTTLEMAPAEFAAWRESLGVLWVDVQNTHGTGARTAVKRYEKDGTFYLKWTMRRLVEAVASSVDASRERLANRVEKAAANLEAQQERPPLPPVTQWDNTVKMYGACKGKSDLFFSTCEGYRGDVRCEKYLAHMERIQAAKDICSTCQAFGACRRLVDYLEADSAEQVTKWRPRYRNTIPRTFVHGVWAGETEYERYERRNSA